MDWPRLVKKYVWDDERTPYFAGSDQLTRRQAHSELFVYAFLLAILASGFTLVAALGGTGAAAFSFPLATLYGATIVLAAVVLGVTGHLAAARYCLSAPVAMGLGAITGGLRPEMTGTEQLVFATASALWLAYALRVVRISRRLGGQG